MTIQPSFETDIEKSRRVAGRWILWVAFLLFAMAQVVWLILDERPVSEERHYFAAARVAHALRGTELGRLHPHLGNDSPYPPLLAYYTGAIMALTRVTSDVAVLSLLPFAGLLLWAVWKIGGVFASGEAAAAAAVLVLGFHHFIDVEPLYAPYTFFNEYMLDLPLSALVATALYYMLRRLDPVPEPKLEPRASDRERRCNAVRLGLAAGGAMLIKVSAPLYLGIAAVGLVAAGARDLKRWWSLWPAAVLALLIAFPWYGLHAGDVLGYLRHHEFNSGLALRDGMPVVGSMANAMYYLQALHAMLSAPLVAVVLLSLLCIVIRRRRGWRLVGTGLLLTYLVLTLLWGKSWRFMTPSLMYAGLAVALAVDAVAPRRRHRRLLAIGLTAGACLRMAMMYGVGAPQTVAQGTVVQLAPVRSDGGIEPIMQEILRERDPDLTLRIAVVPVLRRFRHSAFMQYAMERDIPLAHASEWRIRSDEWRAELERCEFIITRTGYNGPARYVPYRPDIAQWLRRRLGTTVHLINEYTLADGETARLYKQDRTFSTWRRVPAGEPETVLVNFDDQLLLTRCAVENDGTHLLVHCTWQARSAPAREYRLFIQVREGRRNVVARSFIPGDGLLPVTRWKTNERLVETYRLPLPAAGGESLWLGWNRRFRRLPVTTSVYPRLLNAVEIARLPSR